MKNFQILQMIIKKIIFFEHKNIINNLNEKYKKLINKKKSAYDKFNYNINNLMKYSEKYTGLLQR